MMKDQTKPKTRAGDNTSFPLPMHERAMAAHTTKHVTETPLTATTLFEVPEMIYPRANTSRRSSLVYPTKKRINPYTMPISGAMYHTGIIRTCHNTKTITTVAKRGMLLRTPILHFAKSGFAARTYARPIEVFVISEIAAAPVTPKRGIA